MKVIGRLSAFACGVAAVVVMHALVGGVHARTEEDDAIYACADAEGIMRRTEEEVPCHPGERRIVLKYPPLEQPCDKQPRRDLTGLQRRVAELEAHVDYGRLSSPVIAPFEVVNEADIRVFVVEAPNPAAPELAATEIFNDVGARVAVIATNQGGGAVSVFSGSTKPLDVAPSVSAPVFSATIRARDTDAGVTISGESDRRLELGRSEEGRYSLRVFGPNHKMIAGIGESEAGSGIIVVADAAGNPRVRLSRQASSGGGQVVVTNAAGIPVATMSGSGHGGSGLLQLTNGSGAVMVEAGVLDTGVGAVRAGPGAFQHGIMFLGLPGSYINGKK